MRFEARDLKSYAEPLSASELEGGCVYFSVRYEDTAMLMPTLEPLVFIGTDLEPGDSGELYFQDVESHRRGIRYDTATKDTGAVFILESAGKPWIFDYDCALAGLLWCSLKRKGQLRGYTDIRFEERELKPYDEPLAVSDLEEGSVYFSVIFADDDKHIPTLEPLVFIGKNLKPGDSGRAYFQDIDSHQRGVRFGMEVNDDYAYFLVEAENEPRIFDYERALECLMRCSLRRRQMQG